VVFPEHQASPVTSGGAAGAGVAAIERTTRSTGIDERARMDLPPRKMANPGEVIYG
jgi:hypothetical protein